LDKIVRKRNLLLSSPGQIYIYSRGGAEARSQGKVPISAGRRSQNEGGTYLDIRGRIKIIKSKHPHEKRGKQDLTGYNSKAKRGKKAHLRNSIKTRDTMF